MYHRIRDIRATKPIFAMDFQNDGEYVGGCIAGGRRYLHINANGDCDPCVFIHYSNANIRDMSLLDVLRSRHPAVEVVITGRYAPQALIDAADLVTEMCDVKHYYTQGVLSRDGIDR